jgi:phosphoglycerate kinase
MAKLFIEKLDVKGKRVLLRADLNVPLDGEGEIVDTSRIEATLPSIRYVLDNGGTLILMSHLGQPKGEPISELSLAPIARLLAVILDQPVILAPNCVGAEVRSKIAALKPHGVLLLENLRFHRAEEYPDEDPSFAKELASYGECYINDAFGTAHRKHSSTYTLPLLFPQSAAAGYLLEQEIRFLGKLLSSPPHPFYAIMGGAKISTKMGVIRTLLKKVDRLLIGGGMAYTFLKAQGVTIGDSLVDNALIPLATELLKEYGDKITLPSDLVIATTSSQDAPAKIVSLNEGVPVGHQGLDIGPQTLAHFKEILVDAQTVLWNGPVGVYEFNRFAQGTLEIARFLASLQAITIVGGGDSVAALKEAHVADKITHLSTGGGATLAYIEWGTLPGIEALSET